MRPPTSAKPSSSDKAPGSAGLGPLIETGPRGGLVAAYLVLMGGVLLVAVLLSDWTAGAGPIAFDRRVMLEVQNFPGFVEEVSRGVRALTGTVAAMVVGACLIAWLMTTGRKKEAAVVAAIIILLPFVQSNLKEAIDRPRPSADIVDRRAGFSSLSFPSGHLMSMTVAWELVWLTLSPLLMVRWRWLMGLGAALIIAATAVASVNLGLHWPLPLLVACSGARPLFSQPRYLGSSFTARATR